MSCKLRLVLFSLMLLTASFPMYAVAQSSPLVTGVITDRNTGQPIANAQLFFYGTVYGFATTDATGTYTFTASDLTLFGGGISGNLYAGATGYFEAVPVFVSDLSGQPSLPVVQDISLLPGGALIQGVVRDATTGLGISGATVVFNRNPMSTFLGGAGEAGVQTMTDGSYAIDSSYFNESGLTSEFSANLQVNANAYLGETRFISFTSYPAVHDFSLISLNQAPIASAGEDRTAFVGEAVQYSGSESLDPDGTIVSFHWDFGDGATAFGTTPSHIYEAAGTFTVTLTATDNVGVTGTDTAQVNVQSTSQAIESLSNAVVTFNLAQGIANSLDSKIQAILEALEAATNGRREDAANKLQAFINAVEAQRGRALTSAQADSLIAEATRILSVL